MIQLFDVTKRYPGGRVALEEVRLSIDAGEFVFLTGASGAGKTTLLRMVYREELPTAGRILVNGRNLVSLPRRKVPYLRRTVGVVFQDFRLIPGKTVLENVSFLPRVLGIEPQARRRMAYLALRRMGLGHLMSAFPRQLSGGEQQRVAIARALVCQPDILIADEPTGNLDPDLSADILDLLEEVHMRGTTVVVATHDQGIIQRLPHRVLRLEHGRLVEDLPVRPPVATPLPVTVQPAAPSAAAGWTQL